MGSLAALCTWATPAEAYVGPGAGFAFVSTFFIFFLTFALALLTLLLWPLRWFFRALFKGKRPKNSKVKQVVILGLDGQDPQLTRQYMQEGILPNFSRLQQQGAFCPLATTLPAESPVAWSSFQTGCNPGKHRIYDFLVPDRKALLPQLSSARVSSGGRVLKLGKYRIPLGKPKISVGRRSRPFWSILGEYGVFSSIVRVPLSFPPEKFNGVLLAAMCLPDLKGSQGTFFYYSSDKSEKRVLTSGVQLPLEKGTNCWKGIVSGPENSLVSGGGELEIPFEVRLGPQGPALVLDKETYCLALGAYTPWIRVRFRPGLGTRVCGLCRFLLLETEPHLRLYMTPLHIDPARPALPISHPFSYAPYLAKTQAPFATLGVAEDTSALNEGIIDEKAFLKQSTQIHREREQMFFDALDKTPQGCVTCVFDLTDRVQHMFMRCQEQDHPANTGRETASYKEVIRDLYRQMDDLVGQTLERMDPNGVLMVLSDHGFKPFKRCVNLNAWLQREGYLAVLPGRQNEDMLQGVDWSQTRAYALGFGGIYLNLAGREAKGIVSPGEQAVALKAEITQKLQKLEDDGAPPVARVYDSALVYSGPYVEEAPDLVVGFNAGFRVGWKTVTGGLGQEVLEDNTRPWSGDHNMDPSQVPGMFFCNRPPRPIRPRHNGFGPNHPRFVWYSRPRPHGRHSLAACKGRRGRQ